MGTTTLYASKYAYVERGNAGNSHSNAVQPVQNTLNGPKLLLRFPSLSSSLQYRAITSVRLKFGASGHGYTYVTRETFVSDDFDVAALTYETVPTSEDDKVFRKNINCYQYAGDFDIVAEAAFGASEEVKPVELLRNRTCILSDFVLYAGYNSALSIDTPLYAESDASYKKPQLEVVYSDADVGVSDFVPQNPEYINPHVANTIHWTYIVSRHTLTPISVTAESFFWREHGDESYTEIQLTPGAQEVTIPAETFPDASSIDYFVRVTCSSDVTTDSCVMHSSTADTLPTATPIAPNASVEAANEPIVLRWSVANDSGSVHTKSDIQYSTNGGTSWSSLATVNGSATQYTVAAGTFQAGPIDWRVRAYNIDNVEGSWGAASFVALAAPAAPSVLSDAVPFATISWQSEGQQAYQIEVDGKDLGTFFGTGKQFTLGTPLEDGDHTARVRVQNLYGMWSAYGTVVFTVTNSPGDGIMLTGDFGVDAELAWATGESTADFLIFRDGVRIGHTAGMNFRDRHVLGAHEYCVINRLPDGNYSRSSTVQGRMCVRRPMIAPLAGGEWLPLRYSEKSLAEQRFSWSQTHSLRHIAGAKYPVLELSPYEDLSGTYDAAFLSAAGAAAFRTLLGEVVILKSREGKVLIGALTDVSEVVNSFYLAFQFTIEQIHWEDFIDDEDG